MKPQPNNINLIKEVLDYNIYTANTNDARDRFYFFRGTEHLFTKLDSGDHCLALTYAQYYARKSGLVKEAIDFIEPAYNRYKSKYPNEYYKHSIILFEWANNLECLKQHDAAVKMTCKATLYNLVKEETYDNFDFFSFRPCSDYVFSEIMEQYISMMHPDKFNDPLDTVVLQWIKNQENRQQKTQHIDKMCFTNQRIALLNIRVRCFARSSFLPIINNKENTSNKGKRQNITQINPLMWAHYADSHKGICIHYNFKDKFFPTHNKDLTEIYQMGNMEYKKKFSINEFEIEVHDALYAKSSVWKYEHESRLIYYSTNDVPDIKKVEVPDAIKAIYLGLRCSEENEQIIRNIIKGRNIQLYRMEHDINNVYKLKVKPI